MLSDKTHSQRWHRHAWTITRRERNTERALLRSCDSCGEIQRKHRGRWVISVEGKVS